MAVQIMLKSNERTRTKTKRKHGGDDEEHAQTSNRIESQASGYMICLYIRRNNQQNNNILNDTEPRPRIFRAETAVLSIVEAIPGATIQGPPMEVQHVGWRRLDAASKLYGLGRGTDTTLELLATPSHTSELHSVALFTAAAPSRVDQHDASLHLCRTQSGRRPVRLTLVISSRGAI
ncbi:hypothetical protein EI94DRAFT_1818461 [Lactarius quietus]|nr:hypothetical protein EI94DRAFT_1818461 [Lactarius quietus]